MKVERVHPVAVQDGPIFRVRLWTPPARADFAWNVDDYELTECDLDDVLDWAEQQANGNPFELYVRAGSADFYHLRGRPADNDGGIEETIVFRTD